MASSRKQFQNIALDQSCQYAHDPNEYDLSAESLLFGTGLVLIRSRFSPYSVPICDLYR